MVDIALSRHSGTWRDWVTKEAAVLFAIALGVRIVASVVQVAYGLHSFPGLPLSTWADFYVLYGPWLKYVHLGLVPYRDFYTYKYPPLFLYTLYPFFDAAKLQAASVPIIVSDAATSVVVYLISRRFSTTKIAFAAGMLYALSPFVLYYEGYLWLSSQPMTFFLLLAVFLLKEERPVASFGVLAIAALFKQEALFIMPAYLVLYGWEHRANVPRGLAAFVLIIVVVSLPFLIIAPRDYVGSLDYFPLNLGPGEPSQAIASSIVNVAPLEPNSASTCGLQTIPGLFTGSLCGSIVNLKEFASSLLVGKLDQIANFLEPFLLALLAPALYAIRRAPNFLQTACVYSLLACLLLYGHFVEPSLAYYFVPVYALIFASVVDKRSLVLGVGAALLSPLIPEGPFQVMLPLGYLLLTIAVQDQSKLRQDFP